MKRGAVVTVALPGDFGKPRPAVIIQTDLANDTHPTITLLPITSKSTDSPNARIAIAATSANGLRVDSFVMVDKVQTVRRERIGPPIGRLSEEMLLQVSRAVAVWVGIG